MEDECIPLLRAYFRERDRTTPVSQDKLVGSNEPQILSDTNKEETLLRYFGSRTGSGTVNNQDQNSRSNNQAYDSISVPYRSSVMDEEKPAKFSFTQNYGQKPLIDRREDRNPASSSMFNFQKVTNNERETKPISPNIRVPPTTRTFADIIDIEEMMPASSTNHPMPETIDVENPASLSKNSHAVELETERKIVRATRDPNQNRVILKKDGPKGVDEPVSQRPAFKRVAAKSKPGPPASQAQIISNWIDSNQASKPQGTTKTNKSLTQTVVENQNEGSRSMTATTSRIKINRVISTANEDDGKPSKPTKNSVDSKDLSKLAQDCKADKGRPSGEDSHISGKIVIGNDLRVEGDSKSKGTGPVKAKGQTKPKQVTQTAISNFMNKAG